MKNGLVKKGGVASLKAVFFYFVLNNKNYLVFFFYPSCNKVAHRIWWILCMYSSIFNPWM